ncbi:hypothetical protein ACHAPT_009881 [Fusarium lateritium]
MTSTPLGPGANPMHQDVVRDTSFEHEAISRFEEHETPIMEKLAVKCDRVYPCSHCVKTKAHCTFPSGQKPRTRRQRVLISSVYENKIDRIVNRIEELNQSIQKLSLNQAAAHGSAPNPQPSPGAFRPTPSSSEPTPGFTSESPSYSGKPEYEGESSLFAHAVFATKFLQNSVSNNSSSEVAFEMTSVLDALRSVIDAQKPQSDTLESLYPNARPLPPGASLRQLPMPSTDKALACLRMAQDSTRIQMLWLMDFQTIPQFTTHFIKVCSPGPATEADLIICYVGLYWLFCECANVITDGNLKQDYDEQAIICRDSLETVLSRLPFHFPATLDNVYALNMASMYCVQKCKLSAAWNFICAASNLSQSLGLHSNATLHAETPETKSQKTRLFWSVYTAEKMLSLRIGRSSTIRENDITVPRMFQDVSHDPLFSQAFPIWIAISSLQGRIYDEIYCPVALEQPESVRTARARALAAEAEGLIRAEDNLKSTHPDRLSLALGSVMAQVCWYAERVAGLSMLTLIYRSIPPTEPGGSVFCKECIATAREAVKEHEKCVAFITSADLRANYLELYVNWAFLESPFIPFIVLFCHMIETSDPSDLSCLRNLVETLEASSTTSQYSICQRHLSIFKALYDVAVKYFKVRATATRGSSILGQRGTSAATSDAKLATPVSQGGSFLHDIASGLGMASIPTSGQSVVDAVQGQVSIYESRTSQLEADEFDMGIEQVTPTMELATWFYANHHMMRMLEDT